MKERIDAEREAREAERETNAGANSPDAADKPALSSGGGKTKGNKKASKKQKTPDFAKAFNEIFKNELKRSLNQRNAQAAPTNTSIKPPRWSTKRSNQHGKE